MAGAAAGIERAFVASLALHGAVLAGVTFPGNSLDLERAAPEPIAARIVEAAPPEEKKEPPAVKPDAARAPAPKAMPVREKKESEVNIIEPDPSPAPVIAPVAPAAVPAPEPQPVVVASAPAEPSAIGLYRAQLLGAAGRFKRYPEAARENNWTGDVVVRVTVGANAAATGLPEIGVRRGSGHAVLDQQALEMFRQAARAVPVPERLRGREFSLEVRAVYGLED